MKNLNKQPDYGVSIRNPNKEPYQIFIKLKVNDFYPGSGAKVPLTLLGVTIVQTFEYSSKTIKLCALKFFQMKNNTKSHYKLLKSASLVLGQLRNLPVKIEEICFPIIVQILDKIKLFLRKITNSMHDFSYKIITFCQNDLKNI